MFKFYNSQGFIYLKFIIIGFTTFLFLLILGFLCTGGDDYVEEGKVGYRKDYFIEIPSIYLDADLCFSSRDVCLSEGAWLKYYSLEDSNFLITGHNFFLYPLRAGVFYNLADIEEEGRVYLSFDGALYIYEVRDIYITNRYDLEVENFNRKRDTLIIYTCYPNWYNSHRVVVEASRLVE